MRQPSGTLIRAIRSRCMDDRTLGYIMIAAVFAVALIASFLLARRIPPRE